MVDVDYHTVGAVKAPVTAGGKMRPSTRSTVLSLVVVVIVVALATFTIVDAIKYHNKVVQHAPYAFEIGDEVVYTRMHYGEQIEGVVVYRSFDRQKNNLYKVRFIVSAGFQTISVIEKEIKRKE